MSFMMEKPGVDEASSTNQARKRPAPSSDQTTQQRRTRGTYTSVACDGCKRRKLKCIPVGNQASCERCMHNGLSCLYTQALDTPQVSKSKGESDYEMQRASSRQLHAVRNELDQLRHEFAGLSEVVKALSARVGVSYPALDEPTERPVPKQPQFVGPTRSTLGLILGRDSLTTTMGITPEQDALSNRSESPAPEPLSEGRKDLDFWKHCTVAEIRRALGVFKEEIEDTYPFIVTENLIGQAEEILHVIQKEEAGLRSPFHKSNVHQGLDYRDIEILKVAVCLTINLEAKTRTELSDVTLKPIENDATRIAGPEVDLKQVQLLALLSTYYFHNDDELLAWRTVGAAARAALEMGLHRKSSVDDLFRDTATRELANRVFWCVFLLDRRFSFGTGLSFAFQERDIDPDLPILGPEYAYVNCVIGYGMLCSKIWDAIPPFRDPSTPIAKDVVAFLDRSTLEWMETIPPHLKLLHPRQRPMPQPSLLHRYRAMLYLRVNHTRILIYRHSLFSAARIAADLLSANLVVDIAKDSIEVLVHLNATTNMYSRQQSTFNYFLIAALSAIFLAVCHAPKIFKESCKNSFTDAVELIRGFSGRNSASRRLWNSVRDLLPRVKRLDAQGPEQAHNDRRMMDMGMANGEGLVPCGNDLDTPSMVDVTPADSMPTSDFQMMPDFMQMGDNLMDLFDIFGQLEQPRVGKSPMVNHAQDNGMKWEEGGVMLFPGFV